MSRAFTLSSPEPSSGSFRTEDDGSADTPGAVSRRGARRAVAATFLVFAIHAGGVLLLFDPVSGLWNHDPVIEQDWGPHSHHLLSMKAFWKESRALWGYDPLFMAGHPSNTIQDASVKLFELGALIAGGDSPIRAFKILAFLFVASWPWLLHSSARILFGDDSTWVAPLSALLGTAAWWNSLPREMFFYGMIGFPLACALAVWALALAGRAASSSRPSASHVLLTLALTVLLPLHIQGFALFAGVGLPAAMLVVISSRPREPRRLASSLALPLAAVIVAIVLNLPWLGPFLSHRGDDISSTLLGEVAYFTSDDVWTFAKDYISGSSYFTFRDGPWEKGLRFALLALGLVGISRIWRRRTGRSAAAILASGAGLCFALTYFGSFVPIGAAQQPLRFKVALDVFLSLGAAWLIGQGRRGASRAGSLRGAPVMGFVACAGAAAFLVNLASTEGAGWLRLRTRLPGRLVEIVEWARDETPRDARILFEESGDESGFRYQGVYLSSLLAHRSGRELIGGPANVYNDRHHFAEFHSGRLLGRPIESFSDERLHAVFEVYNIGAAVVWESESAARLLGCPGLVTLERRAGPFFLLRATRRPSWLMRGEGSVEAAPGRIRCAGMSGSDVVLKYHLVEGMRSDPSVTLIPERMLDDPIPFVRIENPPRDFVLRLP